MSGTDELNWTRAMCDKVLFFNWSCAKANQPEVQLVRHEQTITGLDQGHTASTPLLATHHSPLGGRLLFLSREQGLCRNINLPLTVFLDLMEDHEEHRADVYSLRMRIAAGRDLLAGPLCRGGSCYPPNEARFQSVSSAQFTAKCTGSGLVPVKLFSSEFHDEVTGRALKETFKVNPGVCAAQYLEFVLSVRLCSSTNSGVVKLNVNEIHLGNAALSLPKKKVRRWLN